MYFGTVQCFDIVCKSAGEANICKGWVEGKVPLIEGKNGSLLSVSIDINQYQSSLDWFCAVHSNQRKIGFQSQASNDCVRSIYSVNSFSSLKVCCCLPRMKQSPSSIVITVADYQWSSMHVFCPAWWNLISNTKMRRCVGITLLAVPFVGTHLQQPHVSSSDHDDCWLLTCRRYSHPCKAWDSSRSYHITSTVYTVILPLNMNKHHWLMSNSIFPWPAFPKQRHMASRTKPSFLPNLVCQFCSNKLI